MSNNQIGDIGLVSFSNYLIQNSIQLKNVNFSSCNVTNLGIRIFSQGIKMNNMTSLISIKFNDNHITNDGTVYIIEFLNSVGCHLKYLELSKNFISDFSLLLKN